MNERFRFAANERTRHVDKYPKKEITEDPNIINLLCGVGNHENKALLVATMGSNPHAIFGNAAYYPGFLDTFRSQDIRTKSMEFYNPVQFCQHSLVPAEIVEVVPYPKILQGEDGYRLTKYGREVAFSFAGHMLDFSLRHDNSLHELFGPTHHFFSQKSINPDTASALPKFAILVALLKEHEPIRAVDVASKLGAARTMSIGQRLKELSNDGIVTYDAIDLGGGESVTAYKLSEDLFLEKLPREMEEPKYRILSQLVYDIAYRNRFHGNGDWLTREKTAKLVVDQNPQFSSRNKKVFRQTIGKVFNHLVDQGLIEKKGSTKIHSEVYLTEPQRATISELVNLLEKIQQADPEFIEEGIQKAREIVNDPEKVKLLMEKASRNKEDALVYPRLSKKYEAWENLGHRISVEALKDPNLNKIAVRRRMKLSPLARLIFETVYENAFQGNADWLTIDDTADIIEENGHYKENVPRESLLQEIRTIYAQFEKQRLVEVWNPKGVIIR